jgi:hypothetical protein
MAMDPSTYPFLGCSKLQIRGDEQRQYLLLLHEQRQYLFHPLLLTTKTTMIMTMPMVPSDLVLQRKLLNIFWEEVAAWMQKTTFVAC